MLVDDVHLAVLHLYMERKSSNSRNYSSVTNLERTSCLSKCSPTMKDLAEKYYDDILPTGNSGVCCFKRMHIESIGAWFNFTDVIGSG